MNQNYKWVAQVSPLRPGGHSTRLNTLRKNALYEGHGFQPCPGVCTFIQRCGGLRVPTGQPKKMMREKREKPPQRDAAEVFPQARFSRNDKMVRKSAMSPLPEHFSMSLGLLADALAKVALPGYWLKCTH